jgi:hypothetical protein
VIVNGNALTVTPGDDEAINFKARNADGTAKDITGFTLFFTAKRAYL